MNGGSRGRSWRYTERSKRRKGCANGGSGEASAQAAAAGGGGISYPWAAMGGGCGLPITGAVWERTVSGLSTARGQRSSKPSRAARAISSWHGPVVRTRQETAPLTRPVTYAMTGALLRFVILSYGNFSVGHEPARLEAPPCLRARAEPARAYPNIRRER